MNKPRLLVQMIVRNEADRYLKEVLKEISKSADKIIILDDNSTDDTVEICRSFPNTYVEANTTCEFVVNESKLRERLWEMVRRRGFEGDWVLTLDADEIFDEAFSAELAILMSSSYDWVSFHLLDLWNRKEYRRDGFWSPVVARLFRFKDLPYSISGEIHCKNVPRYVYETDNGVCRSDIALKHLGYLREEDREKKFLFYSQKSVGLDYIHTQSIHAEPRLKKINGNFHNKQIMIAVPVKDRDWCLKPFLESIFNLDYLRKYITLYFIVNDSTDNTFNILKDWKNMVSHYYEDVIIETKNFGNSSLKEHDWDDQKLQNMSVLRNMYLAKARELDMDYVLAIDSDVLIKDPVLLNHLLNLDRDVVAELHWAKWDVFTHPMPNAWIWGQYEITKQWLTLLKRPSCYPAGGVCGCTLISRDVIEAGVDYSRIYNLPEEIRGEDRFFCISAHAHKFTTYIDTCYPCEHMEMDPALKLKKLAQRKKHTVSLGMMVKNEESYIEQAISCVKPIINECILVDTGSFDKTVHLAKELGAQVIETIWERDYSKPRNLYLEAATSDWILYLDADEYIRPEDLSKLVDLINDDTVDAYLFTVRNYLEDPGKKEKAKYALTESYRLFKRSPAIRFTRTIHEGIEDSLIAESEKREVKIKATDIPILHFGYIREDRKNKHKFYAELYEERLRKDERDEEAAMSLALHYLSEKDVNKAEDIYLRVIYHNNANWRALNNMGVILRHKEDCSEFRAYFEAAMDFMPKNINPLYRLKVEENLNAVRGKDLMEDMIA